MGQGRAEAEITEIPSTGRTPPPWLLTLKTKKPGIKECRRPYELTMIPSHSQQRNRDLSSSLAKKGILPTT